MTYEQLKKDLDIAMESVRETAEDLSQSTLALQTAEWYLQEQKIALIMKAGDEGIHEIELTIQLEPERKKLFEAQERQASAALKNHLAELMLKQFEYQLRLVEAFYKPTVQEKA
jgi:hypothetical protein